MSTIATFMSSAAPAASVSASSSANQGDNTSPILSSQASLYLYTFLVTLVVLLLLSCSIVARSYALRRRHRRLMEDAIRNGTYMPSIRTKRGPGEKPTVHDAFIFEQPLNEGPPDSLCWLETVMPVSASVEQTHVDAAASAVVQPVTTQVQHDRPRVHRWFPFRRNNTTRDTQITPAASRPQPGPSVGVVSTPSSNTCAHVSEGEQLRVAVLIAMPMTIEEKQKHRVSSHSLSSQQASFTDLPLVEFGITKVGLQPGVASSLLSA